LLHPAQPGHAGPAQDGLHKQVDRIGSVKRWKGTDDLLALDVAAHIVKE